MNILIRRYSINQDRKIESKSGNITQNYKKFQELIIFNLFFDLYK